MEAVNTEFVYNEYKKVQLKMKGTFKTKQMFYYLKNCTFII